MIINGELQTGLGGGVCQVSTTVFNAAYEAGLDIDERTNHALYISHYPQGRDATVNYPDLDLKFVNDTKKWLLLRTFVGSSALTVNLYGTTAEPACRVGGGAIACRRQPADDVAQGPDDHAGTARRDGRGVVSARDQRPPEGLPRQRHPLYDNTWYSSYRGEKKIVLVGTKPKPEPEPEPKDEEDDAARRRNRAAGRRDESPPADGAGV